MATLAELRKKAKGMGIAAAEIRGATSASELQEIIKEHGNGNGSKGKKAGKAAVKKAHGAAKKSGTKKTTQKKATAKKTTTAKGNSKKSAAKSAPAKSSKKGATQAKRRATGTDEGRHLLGKINYSDTEGWNPREGSAPDLIHRALKKFKGNREKVFDALVGDLWDFVAKKKQDGTKRSKQEAEKMLRYRIAQTDWRFAIQTGQHEASENRVEYGSGGTSREAPKKSTSTKKSAGSKKASSKAATKSTRAAKTQTAGKKGSSKKTTQKAAKRPAQKAKTTKAGRGKKK